MNKPQYTLREQILMDHIKEQYLLRKELFNEMCDSGDGIGGCEVQEGLDLLIYDIEKELESATVINLCPRCGNPLRTKPNGGVDCSCGYWFCY